MTGVGTGLEYQRQPVEHGPVRRDQRGLSRRGYRTARVMPRGQPAGDDKFMTVSDDRGLDTIHFVGVRVKTVNALSNEITRTRLLPAAAKDEDEANG